MDEATELALTEYQHYRLGHIRVCEALITEFATDQGLGVVADWLEWGTRDAARLDEYAEDAPAYLWNHDA
jgi:hypothetical protein